MSHLFLIFMFISNLSGESVILKKRYTIESSCVPLSLFTKTNHKKCLLTLPKQKTFWEIPTNEIVKLLAKEGIETVESSFKSIRFQQKKSPSYPFLQHIITQKYTTFYPNLRISHISVLPTNTRQPDVPIDQRCSISMPNRSLRRNSGTFLVKCNKKHFFFKYFVKGIIAVYKAKHQIKKDKILDFSNIQWQHIPFEKLSGRPVTDITQGFVAARNIRRGKIITDRMIRPIPDIRRNDRVRCSYRNDTVVIEFDATALQNGYKGETITIKRDNGTTLKAKVVGHKTVEVR